MGRPPRQKFRIGLHGKKNHRSGPKTEFFNTIGSPAVIAAIQRYCPSYVLIAPALLAEVIDDLKTRPIRTRVPVARVTGAFCPPALVKDAVEVLIDEIVTSYGATEVARIAWKSSTENVAEERCVGKVIDGVEAAAFTDDNVQLPAGQEGLIRARVTP
ncbi:MAG: AMP-binding protein [Rhodobacteraceae bacterium]|nr:AMP-binding protein [Paracoccaceae bacterium]